VDVTLSGDGVRRQAVPWRRAALRCAFPFCASALFLPALCRFFPHCAAPAQRACAALFGVKPPVCERQAPAIWREKRRGENIRRLALHLNNTLKDGDEKYGSAFEP